MRAVFFDRDGVINQDLGFVHKKEDFIFMEGIFDLLAYCKAQGYLLFVVTNQSGIGMGYYTQEDFHALSAYMQEELAQILGFGFDGIYFCPHRPDEGCLCRKPKPAMIQEALQKYSLEARECILIGDRMRDVESAQRACIGYKILMEPNLKQEPATIEIEQLYLARNPKEVLNLMQKEFDNACKF